MEVIGYGGNGGGTLINMVKRLNENNMPCTHFMVLGLRFGDIRNMLKNKIREYVFKCFVLSTIQNSPQNSL